MTASFPAVFAAMQEMERKRIAGDLHDSIGQSLSAVCFGLGAAGESVRKGNIHEAGRMLEELAAQVGQAIEEVRRIAHGLNPPALEDVGLAGALAQLIREFRFVHAGIAVTGDIGLDEAGIAPGMRVGIYRLVQEALTNTARHARASHVLVSLRRTAGEIRLEIADDGIGFELVRGGRAGGLGLQGMRGRARLSGGQLRIATAPGQGTRIVGTWPSPV